MNHIEVQENLLLYIDGELPKEISLRMDAHLRDCTRCKEALDSTRSLWTSEIPLSMRSRSTIEWTRFESRIEHFGRHTLQEMFRPSLPVALRIVTLSLLVFCAILFGRYLGDFSSPQQEDGTNVINQLHLDRFQLPEADPFVGTMVRFSGEFEKWGGR